MKYIPNSTWSHYFVSFSACLYFIVPYQTSIFKTRFRREKINLITFFTRKVPIAWLEYQFYKFGYFEEIVLKTALKRFFMRPVRSKQCQKCMSTSLRTIEWLTLSHLDIYVHDYCMTGQVIQYLNCFQENALLS